MIILFDNNICHIVSFLSPRDAWILSRISKRFHKLNSEHGINAYQPLDNLVARAQLVNGLQAHFRGSAYRRILATQYFREGQAIGNRCFSRLRRDLPGMIANALLIYDITSGPMPLATAGAAAIIHFVAKGSLFYLFREDCDLSDMGATSLAHCVVLYHNNLPIKAGILAGVKVLADVQELTNPALLPEMPGARRIYGVFCGVFSATKAYVKAHPLLHVLISKINHLRRKRDD